uniref:Uncharacterized protein n=1 Tax=Arundo donax TaxID=35708 RepID=A0A0A8Y039_ARUDO
MVQRKVHTELQRACRRDSYVNRFAFAVPRGADERGPSGNQEGIRVGIQHARCGPCQWRGGPLPQRHRFVQAREEQDGCRQLVGVLHEGTWHDGGGGNGRDRLDGGASVEEDQRGIYGDGPHTTPDGAMVAGNDKAARGLLPPWQGRPHLWSRPQGPCLLSLPEGSSGLS